MAYRAMQIRRQVQRVGRGSATFVFPVVHSGEYFLSAIPEDDAANWDDPRVMERIARSAMRVLFGEADRKAQDVTTRTIR